MAEDPIRERAQEVGKDGTRDDYPKTIKLGLVLSVAALVVALVLFLLYYLPST